MRKFVERMRPMRRVTFVAIIALTAGVLSCASPVSAMGCSKNVVMYNAWWCPYCRQVRAILARNHIRYSILDASSRVQAIMLRRFGDTGVPRRVIGNVVVEGVDEARIIQLSR